MNGVINVYVLIVSLKMKKHSWKKPDVSFYHKHMSCRNCDLQKAVKKNDKHNFNETYYFTINHCGQIIYGGEKINRVPYGCGDKKPEEKFHLEDELFEI